MATLQELKLAGLAGLLPQTAEDLSSYAQVYEANRHRVYALAFWMTDSEPAAEELMGNVFRRAFALRGNPDEQAIDRALLSELREFHTIGNLTLASETVTEVAGIRRNTRRVHLERAVVQLPATERLIFLYHDVEKYTHERIGQLLGITADECRQGLHQARLRIRELVSQMAF
jgi:DNA-directed RNA polymerase specialized sigma24 family protein